jgi:hypothetical protein
VLGRVALTTAGSLIECPSGSISRKAISSRSRLNATGRAVTTVYLLPATVHFGGISARNTLPPMRTAAPNAGSFSVAKTRSRITGVLFTAKGRVFNTNLRGYKMPGLSYLPSLSSWGLLFVNHCVLGDVTPRGTAYKFNCPYIDVLSLTRCSNIDQFCFRRI